VNASADISWSIRTRSPRIAQAFDAAATLVVPWRALRDQARDSLVVAGDDDLLTLRDPIEQFSKASLGLE
jgi:hypothetical protein